MDDETPAAYEAWRAGGWCVVHSRACGLRIANAQEWWTAHKACPCREGQYPEHCYLFPWPTAWSSYAQLFHWGYD
jgi:hypothetical protein